MVGNKRDKNPELITLESKAAAHEWFTQNVLTHLNQARGKTFMGQEKIRAKEKPSTARLRKLNTMVESVCGIYTRLARRLRLHRNFESRAVGGHPQPDGHQN